MKYENKVWFFLHFLMIESIIKYAFYVINVFMKKVIKQLWQLIFRHRKKLIYGAFAFLVSQICFFNLWWIWIENEVFALDSNTPAQNDAFQEKATEWYEKLSFLKKTVYVLIYPMLVVAWKLADNSYVYWEIFWFDAVLWQLWNIVKNLANFWLWFLFVYKIFEALIKNEEKNIKNLLISSLIAWVWIQASWFIMSALVDVSTIVTYWVWWLPISILKENSSWTTDENIKYNPYVLKDVVYIDVKDIDTMHIYMTNTRTGDNKPSTLNYISECESFSYKWEGNSEELLLAPKMIYYFDGKKWVHVTDQKRCHFGGQVYYFKSLYDKVKFQSCSSYEDCLDAQIAYKASLDEAEADIKRQQKSEVEGHISAAKLLQIWDAHVEWGVTWKLWPILYAKDDKCGLDLYNKWTWEELKAVRLQDILDDNSYVGVFTALYSSLINSWRWVISTDAWILPSLLNAILALCHMLAIWIPLIAVAVVFMMRVGVLWMAIALLPFIILLKAFKLEDKVIKDDTILKYLKINNLIPIIFAPAIICMAISISTVLVVIISKMNVEGIDVAKTEILWWLIVLDVWWLSIGLGRLIISVLWIAITWFLVWAAIEATQLWKSNIIQWMKKLATSALWSVPIVPIPSKDKNWVDFIWASAAFGLWNKEWILSKITGNIKDKLEASDQQAVDNWLKGWSKVSEEASNQRATSYWDKLVSLSAADLGNDWRVKEIEIWEWENKQKITFNSLSDWQKKDVIDKINKISDKNLLAAFGKVWKIEIGNWNNKEVYNFVADKWYELQKNQTK